MNTPLPRPHLHEGRHFPSPVERVLALGYYDGPTEGVLRCGTGEVYRFELLAWEAETQDLRVFALSPLPGTAFDQLVAVAERHEAPRWPVWVPRWHEEMREPIDRLLKPAAPVAWVIATEDLLGEIVAARPVTPGEIEGVENWSTFLGMEGAPPLPARRPGRR